MAAVIDGPLSPERVNVHSPANSLFVVVSGANTIDHAPVVSALVVYGRVPGKALVPDVVSAVSLMISLGDAVPRMLRAFRTNPKQTQKGGKEGDEMVRCGGQLA